MANYILLVQLDIPAEYEDDFNRLYDNEHIPNLLQVNGVHGCTRYKLHESSDANTARYAAVYDIDSPEIPDSPEWKRQSDLGDWATQIRPRYANRTRSIYRKLG